MTQFEEKVSVSQTENNISSILYDNYFSCGLNDTRLMKKLTRLFNLEKALTH